jgi:hypothetical protein
MTIFRASVYTLLAGCLIALPAIGQARESARLWEFDLTTTTGEAPAETASTWVCLSQVDLASPPENLTGPRCEAQGFAREGDTLSWTADCEAARGNGQWIFSRSDKQVQGESQIYVGDQLIRTQVNGKVQDRCG